MIGIGKIAQVIFRIALLATCGASFFLAIGSSVAQATFIIGSAPIMCLYGEWRQHAQFQ